MCLWHLVLVSHWGWNNKVRALILLLSWSWFSPGHKWKAVTCLWPWPWLCSHCSPKHSAVPVGQRHARLVMEECPLTYETQTNDAAKELIEKVLGVHSSWHTKKQFPFLPENHTDPRHGGPACNPGTGRGEDHKCKVILHYITSSKPAWTT